jgi:hypothetical protein
MIKDPCAWREYKITGEPTVIIGNLRKLGQRHLLCRCPIRSSNLTVTRTLRNCRVTIIIGLPEIIIVAAVMVVNIL